MKKVGATYTDFIRTTDPHHVGAVQYIWQKLLPYIYKGTYEGWYCTGCEQFYTDKEATLLVDMGQMAFEFIKVSIFASYQFKKLIL
jgi:methionyl-tRNA synthetase